VRHSFVVVGIVPLAASAWLVCRRATLAWRGTIAPARVGGSQRKPAGALAAVAARGWP
jgi:hypothetical protein